MDRTKSSITLLAALLAFSTVAGCAGLAYLRFDLCPECHLSLSDIGGMLESDGEDPCLRVFTGDPSMLPSYDEVLAELERPIAGDPVACLSDQIPGIHLETGYCAEGGYLFIQSGGGGFTSTTYYFDPATRQLVGYTAFSDAGDATCQFERYAISRIECDEMTNPITICP